jgi:hypothetical protein
MNHKKFRRPYREERLLARLRPGRKVLLMGWTPPDGINVPR